MRNQSKKDFKITTVELPIALKEKVEVRAKELGISRNKLIIIAIEQYLNREGN